MAKDKREDIQEEGIPEGITITSRNDKNIKKTIGRKIIFVLVLASLVGSYLFFNTSTLEKGQSVADVINSSSEYTVLDEAVTVYQERNEDNLIERIDFYDDLVETSEQLHSYDLASVTAGLDHLELPEELDMEMLEVDMAQYEEYVRHGVSGTVLSSDSEDFLRLALKLEAEERLVNYMIQSNAFTDLANLKLLVLKSKVADCCDFGPDSIDRMRLSEVDGERVIIYNGETGRDYRVRFATGSLDFLTSCDLVPNVMNSVFADQSYSETATTEYNHEINERLLEEANITRTLIKMDCSINKDGELQLDRPVTIQRLVHVFRTPENNEN